MVIKQYAIRNREGNYLHIESTINAITGIDEFDSEILEDGPKDFFENITKKIGQEDATLKGGIGMPNKNVINLLQS